MARLICHIFVVLCALSAYGIYHLMQETQFGFQFTDEQLQQNHLKNCRSIYLPISPTTLASLAPAEDIEVDLENNIAFLSVSDVQALSHQVYPPRLFGGISTHFPETGNKNTPRIIPASVDIPTLRSFDWNPVGMSLLWNGEWKQRMLRIFSISYNMTTAGVTDPYVAINRYHPGITTGKHSLETDVIMRNHLFSHPNDLAAISPTQFYITNDHSGPLLNTPLPFILDLMGVGTGNVLYCDTEANYCEVVLDGFEFANSIYLSQDHSLVYVTETIGKKLYVYDRDVKSNQLRLRESIYLDAYLDNLAMDPKGRIWVAATKSLFATSRVIADTSMNTKDAPAIVYRLTPKSGKSDEKPPKWNSPNLQSKGYWIEVMWMDNGHSIPGLSIAAPTRDGKVILGSLVSRELLECEIEQQ